MYMLVAPFCAEAWMCVTPLVEEALLMALTVVFSQIVLVNAAPHSSTDLLPHFYHSFVASRSWLPVLNCAKI